MKRELDGIRAFIRGPGYPGISGNRRGREALYAEREDELIRRYELTRLHNGKSEGDGADRPGLIHSTS
jgi:hypothetical protein